MTQNRYINGAQVCGYLKNLYITSGQKAVDHYSAYIKKELDKKQKLDRALELQEIDRTISWWLANVKNHIDIEREQQRLREKENYKEKRLIIYFVDRIISRLMNANDIKNEIYREQVINQLNELPFYDERWITGGLEEWHEIQFEA